MTTNRDLVRWGALLGHGAARVVPSRGGSRFFGECSCGYASTTRTSERLAVDALIHHLKKSVAAARAQGWEPPRDTPKVAESAPTVRAGL